LKEITSADLLLVSKKYSQLFTSIKALIQLLGEGFYQALSVFHHSLTVIGFARSDLIF